MVYQQQNLRLMQEALFQLLKFSRSDGWCSDADKIALTHAARIRREKLPNYHNSLKAGIASLVSDAETALPQHLPNSVSTTSQFRPNRQI
jgi:hypothetical protein